MLQSLLHHLSENPQRIFTYDAAGAALSAVLLLFVLPHFAPALGLPAATFRWLGGLPVLYVGYDCWCLGRERYLRPAYLNALIYANFTYVLVVIAVALYHRETVTSLGWYWVLVDTFVLSLVIGVEKAVLKHIRSRRT